MASIYYTSQNFEPTKKNPFNKDKPYENDWIMAKLLENEEFYVRTGGGQETVFQVLISKICHDWTYRIMDFIEYERAHNKNIIVSISESDLNIAKREYYGHSYKDNFLRAYENKVLVHSTTMESFQSINNDYCLKSWNKLKFDKTINEEIPIGNKLGDPYDYRDYIMFTQGGVAGEIVVASRQKGQIDMEIDTLYKPGARLYFDAKKIAEDGLLIRDGAHMKVKDMLPLEKYLIWIATLDKVDLNYDEVTPHKFSIESDRLFEKKYGIQLS